MVSVRRPSMGTTPAIPIFLVLLPILRGPMRTPRVEFISMIVLAVAVAACSERSGVAADNSVPGRAAACMPLETREPNAPDQRPAFPGQTRACAIQSNVAFDVGVLAKGLENPWAVEPLPGGDLLVTEKLGRLRIVSATGELGQPIAGVPAVDARGQGGLLDVALSAAFDSDRTIYWSYTEPRQGGNATSVARGLLSADQRRLEQVRVIFRAMPTYDGDKHFGAASLRSGRDAVHHARRALGRTDAAAGAAARQPHGQDPAHQAGRLGPNRQPVRRAAQRAA